MEHTQWESCCPGLCLVPQLIGAGGKLYPLYSRGARTNLIPWHQCIATRYCIPVASLSCPAGLLSGLSWAGFDHCRLKDSQPHWLCHWPAPLTTLVPTGSPWGSSSPIEEVPPPWRALSGARCCSRDHVQVISHLRVSECVCP